jgi:hypothetical protein
VRLIDADALKASAMQVTETNEISFNNCFPYWQFSKCIEQAPTIDAVPMVRCKECEHYNTTGCSVGFGWCESMDRGASDDFYCANGVKMESEDST